MIPYGLHYIDKSDIKNVLKALKSDFITQGPLVEKFEKKICKIVKVKYAVAVSSCTAGLHIALKSIINRNKNKDKDKVLTSPISFASTANIVKLNNLKLDFVDINKDSLNISSRELEKKIKKNKNILSVIPVHLSGYAAHSKEIYRLCKKNNIFVIEDAAHSFGAKYEKKYRVGSCKYSDLTVFSFHPVKTLTTGEGGVITTNSKNLYRKLLILRNHGIEKNSKNWQNKRYGFSKNQPNLWYYEMQNLGFNYRITDFQCALGLSQMQKLNIILKKRKKIAKIYDEHFRSIKNLFIPQMFKRELSSNHLYILNIDFKKIKISRNFFMKELKKNKIITQVHYIPIPLHPYYNKRGFNMKSLKNSDNYYQQALSIPIFFKLNASAQLRVINSIKKMLLKFSK